MLDNQRRSAKGLAVALFVYRRPKLARLAFEAIRQFKPARLYFIADAPRQESEAAACLASQRLVDQLDWDCDVKIDVAQAHLGCSRRVASGVDWVFEHEDRAVFLEDDCVAAPSFFPFCEDLLARFHDDPRVMMITGFNLLGSWRTDFSYSFSFLGSSWGWATWKRAWSGFSPTASLWSDDALMRDELRQLLGDCEVFAKGCDFSRRRHGHRSIHGRFHGIFGAFVKAAAVRSRRRT